MKIIIIYDTNLWVGWHRQSGQEFGEQEPGKIQDGLIGCEKEMEEERIQRPLKTEANGLKERTLTLPLQNLAL